jgi:Transposase
VRYYLGVDWADQTHAVWVVGEDGTKVAARTVPHTAEGFSEWGRELDEWRAQGIERWAAIERREGRVVDFLLDHGVVVYPVNPKALRGSQVLEDIDPPGVTLRIRPRELTCGGLPDAATAMSMEKL